MGRPNVVRDAVGFLLNMGIKARVRHSGTHPKIEFEVKGTAVSYTCSKTASDRRAWLNVRSDLRRMLRELGVDPDAH